MVRALPVLAAFVAVGCGAAHDSPTVHAAAQAPGAIVFDGVVERNGSFQRGYFAIAPDGKALRKLPFPEGEPGLSFSADGRLGAVTFLREAQNGFEVVVSRTDAWEPHRLPLPPGADAIEPSLSPDGKTVALAYVPDEGNSESNVWTVSVDGRGLRQVTSTGRVSTTAWSPDGEWIAFADERAAHELDAVVIYVVRPDGTDLHRIPGEYFSDTRPAWSPDGARIALQDLNGRLVVVAADGSKKMVLSSAGAAPAWSPDGKWVAFARNVPVEGEEGVREIALLIVPAGGGPAHEIGPRLDDEYGPLSWTTALAGEPGE